MPLRGWLLAGVALAALGLPAAAQDEAVPEGDAVETELAAAAPDALLDEDELDALAAPVALYPDALLAQVLVAATVPIDVVKADRFLSDNADLPDEERVALAEAEDWDESVVVLASGFPSVVTLMAEDIDWTEDLGDAMLVQTDDLLDSVQRLRARAAAAGNLESNEVQEVDTTGETISIAPASAEAVYVPTYDPAAAYVPFTGTPVDTGLSTGDILTTGAIAFGSAMLVNEIFDDDDDDYWHGHHSIDWDDDNIYPRRGVNVDGDVNIDRSRGNNNVRIGDSDRSRGDGNGAWKPAAADRDAARQKLSARGEGAGAKNAHAKAKAGGHNDARAKLNAAAADHKARPGAKPAAKHSALKPGAKNNKPKAAANRGSGSLKKSHAAPAAGAKAKAAHPKKIGKAPAAKKAAPRKPAAKHSAMKKPQGGGRKASAAKKRGGNHSAKHRKH